MQPIAPSNCYTVADPKVAGSNYTTFSKCNSFQVTSEPLCPWALKAIAFGKFYLNLLFAYYGSAIT